MIRYVLGRLAQGAIVLWLAYTLAFLAMQVLPSDAVTAMLTGETTVPAETIERVRAFYGLDQPILVQYGTQLLGLLRGDLGYSISTGQQVSERIAGVAASTLALAGLALLFAVLIAAAITAAVALVDRPRLSRLIVGVPPFLAAIPAFWLGIVALQVFSVQLRLVPLFPDGSAAALVAPALVLAVPVSAPLAQVAVRQVVAALAQPYVDVVRAKGASRTRVLVRHVVRNAAGPVLTVLGLSTGALLAGAVVVETVFSRPGFGRILIEAVNTQDATTVQSLVLLAAAVFVLINLAVDLLYPVLDPRILRARSGRRAVGAVA